MDKCTFCAGGPEKDGSPEEFAKYGRNRLSEGKLPACAEMCSTKALLAGDGDIISEINRNRVTLRAARGTVSGGGEPWGWGSAYGRPTPAAQAPAPPPAAAPQGGKS
jgi:formate dehydrogenase iron-sulfur subunit